MRHWSLDQSKVVINSNNSKAELHGFLASRVLLVILSIILIAVLSAFTRDFSQKNSIDSEVSGLQGQINELEMQRDNYLALINYYDSDEYLKQQAKRNLELMEAGEKIVVIPDDELNKYLAIEAELEKLKKIENNDIEDSEVEILEEDLPMEGKLQRQFRLWWEYIF